MISLHLYRCKDENTGGKSMKKRLFAAVMALVLVIAMYSGIQLSSVKANADEKIADVTLSVTSDKTDVRPGDEITVTVNIDKFNPSGSEDTDPFISIWQVFVPIDTDVFEFVAFDEDTTSLVDDGFNFDSAENMVKAVMTYNVTKKNRPNIFYLDTVKNGENATSTVYQFKLKVKTDVADNKNVSLDLSDSSIFKKFNAENVYTYTSVPATVNVIAKELSSIEVSKNPTKTDYFTGSSSLDVTGGKLKLTYTNGNTEEIDITSEMCSTIDFSSAGKKTVKVTYQGKETSFDINVSDKKATDITLKGINGKSIVEGTKLDVAGMSADVTYDDGSVENVALTDSMISYDNSKVGQATATVKISGITKTFTFEVVKKSLTKIEMKYNPTNTDVFVGKTMNLSGAKITATYNNETTEDINVTAAMCSTPDTSVVGEKTVTVTYEGKTTQFKINVVEPQPEALVLNGVDGKSVKEGKELDLTGMTADVKYNDGSVKTVALTKDMLSYSTDKAGQATVKVSVSGLKSEFTITVVAKKAVSMRLSGTDNKSVIEGMKLDLTGINADVTYDNDTNGTVKVTDDMVSYSTAKVGQATATVKIDDLTKTFTFTVVAKTLTGIKVVNAPAKDIYLEGQKFDSTGLGVQAVYDNGTTADVTKSVKLSAIDTAKAGTKTVTVTYEGKTATFTVEVRTREAVNAFNASVAELLKINITKDQIDAVKKLRATYNAMSVAEQAECDIQGLTKLEEAVNKILEEERQTADNTEESADTTADNVESVKTGDTINMYVYMIIILLAGLVATCTVPFVRKNR